MFFWIFAVLIAILSTGIIVGIVGFFYFVVGPVSGAIESVVKDNSVYVDEEKSPFYVIEDGVVAYRPKSTGEKIAANIFSLGTVGRPDWLYGKTLDEADINSFQVISYQYAKDAKAVYFEWEEIIDANPEFFKTIGYNFSLDDQYLWSKSNLVMPLSGLASDAVAYSERFFVLNNQSYMINEIRNSDDVLEVIKFPEQPQTELLHYCRDWLTVNDALWFLDRKVATITSDFQIVDCDSSIRSSFPEGVETEDVEDNRGLTYIVGTRLMNARITGELRNLETFALSIEEVEYLKSKDFALVKLENGEIHAVDTLNNRPTQLLGSAANDDLKTILDEWDAAALVDGNLFLLNEDNDAGEIFSSLGPAKRDGDFYLTTNDVFYHDRIVAGLLPDDIRLLSGEYVISKNECFVYDDYIGDIDWERVIDEDAALAHCQSMEVDEFLEYSGLQIRFLPNFQALGPDVDLNKEECDFCYEYTLGSVEVQNVSGKDLIIDARLMNSISVFVFSGDEYVSVDFEKTGLDLSGEQVKILADQKFEWPLKVQSDVDDLQPGIYLSVAHTDEKRLRFAADNIKFNHATLYLKE